MNLNESIYLKSKELRKMIREIVATSFIDDPGLTEVLLKSSLEIPLHIGMGVNLDSLESATDHLNKAWDKLIELYIAVDLSASEYFKIDVSKLDLVVREIFELIPIAIMKAQEDEERRMDEIMSEFYVQEKES